VATTDPGTLTDKPTWYLATNLFRPRPERGRSPHPAGDVAEMLRIFTIRNWTGQSHKQIKDEVG
jgi:hypothetical protein